MDLALLIIAAKTMLENAGTTATFFDIPPETIRKEDIPPSDPIPQCGIGEKVVYLPSQDRFICISKGFN